MCSRSEPAQNGTTLNPNAHPTQDNPTAATPAQQKLLQQHPLMLLLQLLLLLLYKLLE
jgi:hypothetical protein